MSKQEWGQVIDMQKYYAAKISSGSSATVAQDLETESVARASIGKAEIRREEWRPIAELYPGLSESSILQQAQQLLAEGLGVCERALELQRADDIIEADLEAMRLTPLVTELFCCRAIGEGFGNAIDALMTALRSLGGAPLESNQLFAIRECLEKLHDAPALSFDDSLHLVDGLEDADLKPNPDLGGLAGDI